VSSLLIFPIFIISYMFCRISAHDGKQTVVKVFNCVLLHIWTKAVATLREYDVKFHSLTLTALTPGWEVITTSHHEQMYRLPSLCRQAVRLWLE